MLGRVHRSQLAILWSTARALELCPVGTVVRNGCDHRAPAGSGRYLKKIRNRYDGQVEWLPCDVQGNWYPREAHWISITSSDVHLPVQVIIRGVEEYEG